MQFCESWLCNLALVSLSWYPFFSFFFESPSSPSLSLCLSIYLSLSPSLSIVMFEFELLYKKRKRKKNYLSIYLFFFGSVWPLFWPACAYAWARMVRSGLLLLTRSRWNAVRFYGIQFVYQCLSVLANHRRRVVGCLANKLQSSVLFLVFTN